MIRWRRLGLALMLALLLAACGGCRGQRAAKGSTPKPLPNRTVTVLCYHNLTPGPAATLYDTSVADFTAQLGVLKKGGYQSISCARLASYLRGQADLPARAVLITIDDGRKSVVTQFKPQLDRFGYQATVFAITGSIGAKGNLTWEDLKALQAARWEVGSHTMTHANLTRRGMSVAAVGKEITQSFQTLSRRLGAPPVALAYPYGNYDATAMQATRTAGYALAFTINPGVADQASEPYGLPRKMIVKGTSLKTLQTALTTQPLHLQGLAPALGRHVRGPAYVLQGIVRDADARQTVRAEGGRGAKIRVLDPATGAFKLTTTLRKGANLVRVSSAGPPRREASWIVICDP